MFYGMITDGKAALRSLRKSPLFALVAIASLALGVGANTALFSMIDHILWRSLAIREPDRLALLESNTQAPGHVQNDVGGTSAVLSLPLYRALALKNGPWNDLIARSALEIALGAGGRTEVARAELVSGNFFPSLGLTASRGRLLEPADDVTWDGHPVTVLAYDFWRSRFGADPSILGSDVRINGRPMRVVGIGPEGFRSVVSGQQPSLYVTLSMAGAVQPLEPVRDNYDFSFLNVLARLKPGVSVPQAQASGQPLFRAVLDEAAAHVPAERTRAFAAQQFRITAAPQGINVLRDDVGRPLMIVFAMVGSVLLIACLNLAALLLVRATVRRREVALRLALGANRGQLMRLLLAESVILAAAGGIGGLLVSSWMGSLLIGILPEGSLGGWLTSDVDGRVFVFAFSVTLASMMVSGLLPAWQASRADLAGAMQEQSRGGSEGVASTRWRTVLVVSQVALAVVLLNGAGLFAKSLMQLLRQQPGFRTSQLIAFSIDASNSGYLGERRLMLYEDLQRRLRDLPGVDAAAMANVAILGDSSRGASIKVEGYTPGDHEEPSVALNSISASYFHTLGIAPLQGREFTPQDSAHSPQVAIVNQAFVKRYNLGDHPLGRRLGVGAASRGQLTHEIVGVVPDTVELSLRDRSRPEVYVNYTQDPKLGAMTFYLRTPRDPQALAEPLRGVVRQVDPNLPIYDLRTLDHAVHDALATERLVAIVSAGMGGLALLLTSLGLYGVLAFSVQRRAREIGIRIALGARPAQVLSLVGWSLALLLASGLAIGVPVAALCGRLLQQQLFNVSPVDGTILAAALGVLAFAAACAALGPLRTAMRVDPADILRAE